MGAIAGLLSPDPSADFRGLTIIALILVRLYSRCSLSIYGTIASYMYSVTGAEEDLALARFLVTESFDGRRRDEGAR